MASKAVTSYAQQFEDIMLWRALKDVEHGAYIDIGASQPVDDSVSLLFYEQNWRGIHVEPSRKNAELLRQARPDELVIEAAIGSGEQRIMAYGEPLDQNALGLGSTSSRHLQLIQDIGYRLQTYSVVSVTLDDVFQYVKTPDIHWMKIDIEALLSNTVKDAKFKICNSLKSNVLFWAKARF